MLRVSISPDDLITIHHDRLTGYRNRSNEAGWKFPSPLPLVGTRPPVRLGAPGDCVSDSRQVLSSVCDKLVDGLTVFWTD